MTTTRPSPLPRPVHSGSLEFAEALRRARRSGEPGAGRDVEEAVRAILRSVRTEGDAALLRLVAEHDGVEASTVAQLRLDLEGARPRVAPSFERAVERSIDAVQRFHEPQRKWAQSYALELDGVEVEERVFPLRRVGLYVPGGRFPYPSTVIMSVVPARVAGVDEIVVATPPSALERSDELVFVLQRLGVNEVWGMGGAHAVAALAYGTSTVGHVDLIAGPGNVWVTAAKQQVRGVVGTDKVAGPSEVVIVADASADPAWVAADLLAQAEHDPEAVSVLVTPSAELAGAVAEELERQLADLPTAETARQSLAACGALLVTSSLDEALEIAEELAAEHQQLMGVEAEALADRVRNAGALFVGSATPTCFGDYAAGPSHVLPTGGSARFSSGLSVMDFLRRSHRVRCTDAASRELAEVVAGFAEVEGLEAHRRSAVLRCASDPAGASIPEGTPAPEREDRS